MIYAGSLKTIFNSGYAVSFEHVWFPKSPALKSNANLDAWVLIY